MGGRAFFLFLGDFYGYCKLCQNTSGKMAKTISWFFWLKPLQRVFELDPEESGLPSIYSPTAVHLKAYNFGKKLWILFFTSPICG